MQIDKKTLDYFLAYDPETGLFTNRFRRSASAPKDAVAGTRTRLGYIRINVGGRLHYAQRLAWLTMTGAMPHEVIDHINGNPSDNRFVNLRDISHAENLQNQFRPTGKNPYIGVSLVRGRWQSSVSRFGLSIHLGLFETAEEASLAYQKSKALTHQEFADAARKSRRMNKLTLELSTALQDFPGFDCAPNEKDAWLAIRSRAIK